MTLERVRHNIGSIVLVLLLCGGLTATIYGQLAPKGWTPFVSTEAGYKTYYPPGWYRFPPLSAATLNIYNYPFERSGGGAIPDHGASIAIVPSPRSVATIDEWINADRRLGRQESKELLSLRRSWSSEPLPVSEVVHEAAEGEESVGCYFQISGHLFVGRLIYWKGDAGAPRLRSVLHEVVGNTSLLIK